MGMEIRFGDTGRVKIYSGIRIVDHQGRTVVGDDFRDVVVPDKE